jgi:glycosyltransferase involved in cell wall biosynthesis
VRVLFVTGMHPSPEHPLRGVIVERLQGALEARGLDIVNVFCERGTGPARYWAARKLVRDAVRRERPDIVHVHFGYSGLAVPCVSTPLVTSFYGDDLNLGLLGPGLRAGSRLVGMLISQFTAWRSARCIVVSSPMRLRLWFGSARRKTVVVRDSVDPRMFRPIPREAARLNLGLPMNDLLIIFPHRATEPNKRVSLAQMAVTELRLRLPQAKLWIVNDRPPDEMPLYYAAADAMIVTSEREGGPSSAKEALACGLPVVSVRVGDTDLFAEADGAMLEACDNPRDLANALERALALHREPRRSHLPRHLELSQAAEQIERLYQAVVSEVPT